MRKFAATLKFFCLSCLAVVLSGCPNNDATVPENTAKPAGVFYVAGVDQAEVDHIFAIQPSSGSVTKLAVGTSADVTDEGTLIVASAMGIVEVDPATTSSRNIVEHVPQGPWYQDDFRNPRVSPDGQLIAYNGQSANVYVVNRWSGALIGEYRPSEFTEGFTRISWTPDGRLAFANEATNDIYFSDPGLTAFTNLNGQFDGPRLADVSPDGSQIAFVQDESVFVIGSNGTGLRQLTNPISVEAWPTWSSDGKSIAIYANQAITVLNLTTGTSYDISDASSSIADFFLRNHSIGTGINVAQFVWR